MPHELTVDEVLVVLGGRPGVHDGPDDPSYRRAVAHKGAARRRALRLHKPAGPARYLTPREEHAFIRDYRRFQKIPAPVLIRLERNDHALQAHAAFVRPRRTNVRTPRRTRTTAAARARAARTI